MRQRAFGTCREWPTRPSDPPAERWYSDDAPHLGEAFTSAHAITRRKQLVKINGMASRSAQRARDSAMHDHLTALLAKLEGCAPNSRCGSPACPECARAAQKVKVRAHRRFLKTQHGEDTAKLVLVTLVHRRWTYFPGSFEMLDLKAANKWLAKKLCRLGRVIVGSIDLSWETTRQKHGTPYLQLHWHLSMWTSNPAELKRKLRRWFPRSYPYERPVDVKLATDLHFTRYVHKLIKLPTLLRNGRRILPELALTLDAQQSLDFLFMTRAEIVASETELRFRRARRKGVRSKPKCRAKVA